MYIEKMVLDLPIGELGIVLTKDTRIKSMRNYNSGVDVLKKEHAQIERQRKGKYLKRTISIPVCVGRHSNGGIHDI